MQKTVLGTQHASYFQGWGVGVYKIWPSQNIFSCYLKVWHFLTGHTATKAVGPRTIVRGFSGRPWRNLPPHMGDPHGGPQTSPHGLGAFSKKTIWEIHVDWHVVGWSAGRHVDHPCGGGQISPWPARKVTDTHSTALSASRRQFISLSKDVTSEFKPLLVAQAKCRGWDVLCLGQFTMRNKIITDRQNDFWIN